MTEQLAQSARETPIHIGNRIDRILMAFFKEFFTQPRLVKDMENEFLYVDNKKENSLIIKLTDDADVESVNAVPMIVIQDGGWQERNHSMNDRHAWVFGENNQHKTVIHAVVKVECLARRRGTAKLLQSIVAQAIIMLRRVLYEFGIDTIPDIQAEAPIKLSSPASNAGPWVAGVMMEVYHSVDWGEVWGDDFEEDFLITVQEALRCDPEDGGATRQQTVPAYQPPEPA